MKVNTQKLLYIKTGFLGCTMFNGLSQGFRYAHYEH